MLMGKNKEAITSSKGLHIFVDYIGSEYNLYIQLLNCLVNNLDIFATAAF